MWMAFVSGALIVIGLVYLLEEPCAAQRLRATALGAMIGMMWGLAIIFNHPFVGNRPVSGAPWCKIVEQFDMEIDHALPRGKPTCPINYDRED
jgi:hypothetical protein